MLTFVSLCLCVCVCAAELEFVQIIIIIVVMTVMVVVIICLLNHYKLSTWSFITRQSQARRHDHALQQVSPCVCVCVSGTQRHGCVVCSSDRAPLLAVSIASIRFCFPETGSREQVVPSKAAELNRFFHPGWSLCPTFLRGNGGAFVWELNLLSAFAAPDCCSLMFNSLGRRLDAALPPS